MKKALCLVSVDPVKLKDKITGEENIRFKYIFLTEKEGVVVGWASNRLADLEPTGSEEFDSTRARDIEVKYDSFNGKLVLKAVLEPQLM